MQIYCLERGFIFHLVACCVLGAFFAMGFFTGAADFFAMGLFMGAAGFFAAVQLNSSAAPTSRLSSSPRSRTKVIEWRCRA